MAQALREPRRRRGQFRVPAFVHEHEARLHPGYFRGRQHIAAIIVVGLLALVAFRMFPAQDVIVLNNGRAVHVRATFDAQDEALERARVELGRNDRVVQAEGGGHLSVAVQRARPVTIQSDGETLLLKTQAETVGGALAAAGIEIHEGDQVYVNGSQTTGRGPIALEAQSLASRVQAQQAIPLVVGDGQGPVISVVRARPVTVHIDGTPHETRSAAATVGSVLEGMGIIVREEDLVTPGLEADVSRGMVIEVAKAQAVSVTIDGTQGTMYTQAETVAEVLDVLGIALGPDDSVSPSPETPVGDGSSVTIARTRVVEEEEREAIAPNMVSETDPSMAGGEVRIIEGKQGIRLVRYEVTYRNGELVSREAIASEVLEEPTPTRHITGVQAADSGPPSAASQPDPAPGSSGGFSGSYRTKMTVLTTWYNATHGGKDRDNPWYGYTSTGAKLRKGICATDPSVIPLGTWMYIPGYGRCLAADIGGAVKGKHVDLGFPESAGNSPWGMKTMEIYILD